MSTTILHPVRKELVSMGFGLLSTAAGFFLALFLNQQVEDSKDREVFAILQKSLLAEVQENRRNHLNNPVFIQYASPELLIALQNYIRKCDLANRQNEKLREMKLSGLVTEEWTPGLKFALKKTMGEVRKSVKELLELL